MKVTLNKNKNRIEVITQDPFEYNQLNRFPGLIKDGISFIIPAKSQVAFNLVHRLFKTFPKKISATEEVMVFINKPFKLKEIPASFKYYTPPIDFQEIALRYLYTLGGGGLLLEPGMGKTKIILDFIALMKFKKSLIICPKALLFVWEDELALHRPDKTIHIIKSTEWEKEKEGILSKDVTVINYDKVSALVDHLINVDFTFLGVDESLIKDPKSGRTKCVTWLGRKIPHKAIMSGTLVNNSPLDVFAPVRFLEPSLTGNNFVNFKNRYTVQVGPIEKRFVVAYKDVEEVKSILESTSIVMTKERWLKLPPKKFTDVWVQPSEEQRTTSIELQSNYIVNIGNKTLEVSDALTVLCKLIQIANGFVYIYNPDECIELQAEEERKNNKRETYYFPEQPKIAKLIELLTGQLKGRRAVIWYNMQGEYELITKALQNGNFKWLSILGGDTGSGDKIRTFNRDPSYDYILCQSKAINYGVTILGKDYEETALPAFAGIRPEVHTQVFYSLNFSLETYLQQQDRIHRIGQEFECDYFRLFTNTVAERHIKEKIDEKQSIRGQILQDILDSIGIRIV